MCVFPKYLAYDRTGSRKIIKRDPFLLPDEDGWFYAVIPCRQCPECLQAKQINMINKALFYEETHKTKYLYFITLTINDFYINYFDNYNVKLDYIQKFIKRLRRCRNAKGDKYILVEEFGNLHDRRHFHAIYFTDYEIKVSQVRRCWDYGFIKLDNLSYNQDRRTPILYTLKYINKSPSSFMLMSKGFTFPDRFDFVPFTNIKLNPASLSAGASLQELKQYYADNKAQ